jgi:hypothetical protein
MTLNGTAHEHARRLFEAKSVELDVDDDRGGADDKGARR